MLRLELGLTKFRACGLTSRTSRLCSQALENAIKQARMKAEAHKAVESPWRD